MISNIVEKGIDFKRLRIGLLNNNKAFVRADLMTFRQTQESIYISTSHQRLEKLANEILSELHKTTKIQEWKPTFQELEAELLKKPHGFDLWLVDVIRAAVSSQNKNIILQFIKAYEWLKSNEQWLYEAKTSVEREK